jgi:hypothetical protein
MKTTESMGMVPYRAEFPVSFLTRAFTAMPERPVTLVVERMTWADLGGPAVAEIACFGRAADLLGLVDLLRCPVEIWDRAGTRVWWGWVARVDAQHKAVRACVDLEAMANRAAVRYSLSAAENPYEGERQTTAWAENAAAAAEYGRKERLYSLSGVSSAAAAARRDLELSLHGWPELAVSVEDRQESVALLTCRGWWDTLDWVYYANPAGIVEYTDEGSALETAWQAAGSYKLAESFTCATGGWLFEQAWLKMLRSGTPGDSFRVDLCLDSAGSPGTVLDSALLAGGSVDTATRWHAFSFSGAAAAQTGVTYWLVGSRTGAADGTNAYKVHVNRGCTYAGGQGKTFNGAAWTAFSPPNDVNFRVCGGAETTEQVRAMCASGAGGQFLRGVTVEQGSGLFTNPYRPGDRTARAEVSALLSAGGAAGQAYLAAVTPERGLRVYPRPSAPALRLDADGSARWLAGSPAAGAELPGQLVRIDVPWIAGGQRVLTGQEVAYIRGAEWRAGRGLRPVLAVPAG